MTPMMYVTVTDIISYHCIQSDCLPSHLFPISQTITQEEDSDPFNKFWEKLESLVQKLSNPVAFATVPLHGADNPFNSSTIPPSLPYRSSLEGAVLGEHHHNSSPYSLSCGIFWRNACVLFRSRLQ